MDKNNSSIINDLGFYNVNGVKFYYSLHNGNIVSFF